MGKTKDTQSSQQTASTAYTPTAEETEFNKLQLAQAKEFDPIQRDLNKNAGNLINQLLLGEGNLPGFLSKLPGGIDENVTNDLVSKSLRDVNAQLAASGAGSFMESGVAQSVGARTAGDIRMGAEQFNIGNLLNLLNLAVGGQAQVQQPTLATSNMLSQRLSGLRNVSQTGTMNGTSVRKYDFFTSPFTHQYMQSVSQAVGGAR